MNVISVNTAGPPEMKFGGCVLVGPAYLFCGSWSQQPCPNIDIADGEVAICVRQGDFATCAQWVVVPSYAAAYDMLEARVANARPVDAEDTERWARDVRWALGRAQEVLLHEAPNVGRSM